MTLLKQFLELGLDCSPIGLGPGPSQGGYFCTPKGLTVLGWEGVDGIHFSKWAKRPRWPGSCLLLWLL